MKEVILASQMREFDRLEIEKNNNAANLMKNAALGIYNNVSWYGKIGVFCGSGNNAGDGYCLSLILKSAGHNVEIIKVSENVSETSKEYYNQCLESAIPVLDFNKDYVYDIIVDCLLGTGVKGMVNDKYKEVIDYINDSDSYVVSCDIPSGLSGDNGMGYAVCCDLCVSIGSYKYGHFLSAAKDHIKKLINVDIGIPTFGVNSYLIEKKDFNGFFKYRPHLGNKGLYGYVSIIGGCERYPGAVRLASMGQNALYAGAGVSRVCVPDVIKDILYASTLESTIYPFETKDGCIKFDNEKLDYLISSSRVISIGIGIGESVDTIKMIEYLINNYKGILIIDADGLNNLSKLSLDILNRSNAKIVLTPHLKEFSRLTRLSIDEIMENIDSVTKKFVEEYHVTLLLKGPTTIVRDSKVCYLVDRGAPGMATAGSGDVLTGILTGILGYQNEDVTFSVACGAFVNGMAGEMAEEEYGDIGMVASDTARMTSKVIKYLSKR